MTIMSLVYCHVGTPKIGEPKSKDITSIALLGEGMEHLMWNSGRNASENDLAYLPAGRSLDFQGKVRYGVWTDSN